MRAVIALFLNALNVTRCAGKTTPLISRELANFASLNLTK